MFRVDKDSKQHVNISTGPLGKTKLALLIRLLINLIIYFLCAHAAYRYQFEEIYIHYGIENNQGSEHQIQGYAFPGEVRFQYKKCKFLKKKFFKHLKLMKP